MIDSNNFNWRDLTKEEANELARQIKAIYSLEDAIREFGTEDLKRESNGEYRSISILDPGNDKTCTRYQFDRNKWTDFKGYGKRVDGDQIDYVKVKLNLSCFKETIGFLAQKKGLLVNSPESKPTQNRLYKNCIKYNNILNQEEFKAVREYLYKLRISQERIDKKLIGLQEHGKDFKLEPRIIFPYWNDKGTIVYRQARALPEKVFNQIEKYKDLDYFDTYDIEIIKKPNGKEKWSWSKYKKLPIKYYKDECNIIPDIPYNFDDIDPFSDTVVICEGIPDSEALISQGINNICITSTDGTDKEGWNNYIFPILEKTENIIFCGDNDQAGKGATIEWAKKLLEHKIFNFDFMVVPRSQYDLKSFNNLYSIHFLTDKEVEEVYSKNFNHGLIKDIGEYLQVYGSLDDLKTTRINGFSYLALHYFSTIEYGARTKYIKEVVYPYKRFLQPYQIDVIIEDIKKVNLEGIKEEDIKAIERAFRAKPKESQVINSILENNQLIHEHGVGFYEYNPDSHVWQELTEETVDGFINTELGDQFSEGKMFSSIQRHLRTEVNDPNPLFNQKNVLVFNNGTLYLNNGKPEFKENLFDPEDHVTFKCNYNFDAEADYLPWVSFLTDVLEVVDHNGVRDQDETDKKIALAQEFFGYFLHPDSRNGKACLVIVGNSDNGKSVFMDIAKALFDEKAVTSVPIQDLGERFQIISLKNSVINISEESEENLTEKKLKAFNNVVAGGTVRDSKKGKDVIEFRTRAKWIISGNNRFHIGDNSNAVYNRILYLDFPFTFTFDENKLKQKHCKKKDPNMTNKLLQYLPGIFRWTLEGYERLIENNFEFTLPNEHLAEIETLKTTNNGVREFITDSDILTYNQKEDGSNNIEKNRLYEQYCNFAKARTRGILGYQKFNTEFGRQLQDLGVDFKRDRIRENGVLINVYKILSIPKDLADYEVTVRDNSISDFLEIL